MRVLAVIQIVPLGSSSLFEHVKNMFGLASASKTEIIAFFNAY